MVFIDHHARLDRALCHAHLGLVCEKTANRVRQTKHRKHTKNTQTHANRHEKLQNETHPLEIALGCGDFVSGACGCDGACEGERGCACEAETETDTECADTGDVRADTDGETSCGCAPAADVDADDVGAGEGKERESGKTTALSWPL